MPTLVNSTETINQLVNDHINLAKFLVNKYHPQNDVDKDELYSLAFNKLFRCAKVYTLTRGCKFSSFFAKMFKRDLFKYWKRNQKRISTVNLDKIDKGVNDPPVILEQITIFSTLSQQGRLSPQDILLLHNRYIQNQTGRKLAQSLGISPQRICTKCHQVLAKLPQELRQLIITTKHIKQRQSQTRQIKQIKQTQQSNRQIEPN